MKDITWTACICALVGMVLWFLARHLLPFLERRVQPDRDLIALLMQTNFDLTIQTYHRIDDRYHTVVQALTHISLALDMCERDLHAIKDKLPRMARTRVTDRTPHD